MFVCRYVGVLVWVCALALLFVSFVSLSILQICAYVTHTQTPNTHATTRAHVHAHRACTNLTNTEIWTRTPSMHKFDKHRNLVCADSRLMQELATQIPTFRARNTSPRRSTLAGVWQGRGVLEPRSWPNCEGRTLDMRYFYVWCWVCPDPALRARQSRERRWSDLILTTSASRTRKSMIDSAVAGMY